jgi:ABC-type branched-subunit amino acid transport system substrate-binding protein
LPCAGCHGRDGKGRAEGGVKPTNIVWENLTKPYGGIAESGRKYDTYDEYTFLRAVNEGIDSSGNKLDSSMPRYNISRQDAGDLVAYLKVIADDFDPGITDGEIIIGTLQPTQSYQKKVASAMISVINAQFDEVNKSGGLYGRHLKLKVVGYEDRQSFIGATSKLIGDDKVFALLGTFSASADQALTDMVEEAEILSVGPYTQFPTAKGGQHHYTFYMHGGLDSQVGVLTKRIGEQAVKSNKTFVFYSKDGRFRENAENAIELLEQNDISDHQLVEYDPASSDSLSDLIDPENNMNPSILFLGSSSELLALIEKSPDLKAEPRLYVPGFFVTSHILELPQSYAALLEMTYTSVPGAEGEESLREFREFIMRNKLGRDFLTVRLFAYSAGKTLVEGIKRSGKRITRKKVMRAMEDLYNFNAGLNKPISYGSRRRTGLHGAYVVKLDAESKRLSPTGTWVRLD